MPKKRKLTPEAYRKSQQYIKQTYNWVNIQFNKNDPEEMAIYAHISSQGQSKAAYLKKLVMMDMIKNRVKVGEV